MITKTTLAVCLSFTMLNASVFAGTVGHLISLTEFSSTSLTATYDGSAIGVTVTPGNNPDSWTVVLPASAFILGFGGAVWAEPEPGLGNAVSATANSTLLVTSDVAATFTLANQATILTGAFDTRDATPISITFNDVEDAVVAVPESGSTFGLLALGLAMLLGARRLRHLRLA